MGLVVDGEPVVWSDADDAGPVVTLASGPTPPDWRWMTPSASRKLPPYDLEDVDWCRVPELRGVDVVYSSTELEHLLGDVTVRVVVRAGRPVSVAFGGSELRDGVDVWFEYPAVRRLEQRAGRITSTEMVAPPGDFGGSLKAAMLIAGLVDPWAPVFDHTPNDLEALIAVYRQSHGRILRD